MAKRIERHLYECNLDHRREQCDTSNATRCERMNKMTTKAKEASLEDIVKEKKDNSIDDQKEIPEK